MDKDKEQEFGLDEVLDSVEESEVEEEEVEEEEMLEEEADENEDEDEEEEVDNDDDEDEEDDDEEEDVSFSDKDITIFPKNLRKALSSLSEKDRKAFIGREHARNEEKRTLLAEKKNSDDAVIQFKADYEERGEKMGKKVKEIVDIIKAGDNIPDKIKESLEAFASEAGQFLNTSSDKWFNKKMTTTLQAKKPSVEAYLNGLGVKNVAKWMRLNPEVSLLIHSATLFAKGSKQEKKCLNLLSSAVEGSLKPRKKKIPRASRKATKKKPDLIGDILAESLNQG